MNDSPNNLLVGLRKERETAPAEDFDRLLHRGDFAGAMKHISIWWQSGKTIKASEHAFILFIKLRGKVNELVRETGGIIYVGGNIEEIFTMLEQMSKLRVYCPRQSGDMAESILNVTGKLLEWAIKQKNEPALNSLRDFLDKR